ncbi:retrovirus-related pol polyprotein from transposon TNT 1-94 [Tanacetum coccineum]
MSVLSGKDNSENIMKSLNDGNFIWEGSQMLLPAGNCGCSSTRSNCGSRLSIEGRYMRYQGRPFQRNNARGNGVGGQNRGDIINPSQANLKCYTVNGIGHIARGIAQGKATSEFRLLQGQDVLMQAGECVVVLDARRRFFLQENKLPTLMMMWIIHPRMIWHSIWIISLKLINVMYSTLMLMRLTMYKHHVHVSGENGVQSNVSSVQNDALMSIINEMHEEGVQQDYSKENLLATFAPQRNLTPEQIFWSIDENDRKKAETSVPKPLSALIVSYRSSLDNWFSVVQKHIEGIVQSSRTLWKSSLGQSDSGMITLELSWVMEIMLLIHRKEICLRGLPRLKFEKDHLCSACQLGKSKKFSHKPKSENTNMEVLHTRHMDLCGPIRVHSIKGKKYILVIVDDYLRFTWVKFLRSKDETPEFVINFLKQIQVGLNKIVRYIRTDNRTKLCLNTMKVLAYFIKNLFQELLNKTALSKDEIIHLWKQHVQ